jgi:hypothetical protein
VYARKLWQKAKPTTSHNPQANAIIERVHKVVNDMIRSFDLENNHQNLEEYEDNHLITSFNQLHLLLEAPIIQHCRQHHAN